MEGRRAFHIYIFPHPPAADFTKIPYSIVSVQEFTLAVTTYLKIIVFKKKEKKMKKTHFIK